MHSLMSIWASLIKPLDGPLMFSIDFYSAVISPSMPNQDWLAAHSALWCCIVLV